MHERDYDTGIIGNIRHANARLHAAAIDSVMFAEFRVTVTTAAATFVCRRKPTIHGGMTAFFGVIELRSESARDITRTFTHNMVRRQTLYRCNECIGGFGRAAAGPLACAARPTI